MLEHYRDGTVQKPEVCAFNMDLPRLLPDGRAAAGGADLPWQRVINARGEISPRSWDGGHAVQRALLEDEGIDFDLAGRVDLRRFRWHPAERRARCGS